MNNTIETMLRHRSIRKFKPDPVAPELIRTIVECGQTASTSSGVQAYSVIGVTDKELKSRLAALSGNAHVGECAVFFVWCADLYRLGVACDMHGVPIVHETAEQLLIATVDTALAAQNAAVAAESLGLGIVYIGGIRNEIEQVSELLQLPQLVYPVFGMCVGYPDQMPAIRPRLPFAAVYHENGYQADKLRAELDSYDETYRAYMVERSGGRNSATWTEQMAARMGKPMRTHMRAFLHKMGFRFT